ncbi:MAG: hypothetical protein ACRC62_11490 [Microcoleus sp.]
MFLCQSQQKLDRPDTQYQISLLYLNITMNLLDRNLTISIILGGAFSGISVGAQIVPDNTIQNNCNVIRDG